MKREATPTESERNETNTGDVVIRDDDLDTCKTALCQVFGARSGLTITPLVSEEANPTKFLATLRERVVFVKLLKLGTTFSDADRYFRCLEIAAASEIAPAVKYADPRAGIVISDFVRALPISERRSWGPPFEDSLPELVFRLHGTIGFPEGPTIFEMMCGLWTAVRELSGASLPDLLTRGLEYYGETEAVLRPRRHHCSCHNDLNPTNILFDGVRPWLVDWEMASVGDPAFDLATLLTFTVRESDHNNSCGHTSTVFNEMNFDRKSY